MPTSSELDTTVNQEIAQQTALLKELRNKHADASAVDEVKKRLGELKKSLALLKLDKEGSKEAGKDAGKKRERLLLKTAKGTRDYGPAEMFCRLHIERIVQDCFRTYGGSCLDTPVFERKDVLAGKYGEDAKLIFDLMDQGGEQLALRYDHTVPLARYLAMNGAASAAATNSKLWQIGKVYRRDNPVVSKGRMREFSQADFDIAGVWDPMIPDAELISLLCTILGKLDVGEFTVKINHRKILDGIFEVCGVPPEKIRSISSAVDKLDKLPWVEVKKEMTDEKGLDHSIADKIGEYVKHTGGPSLLEQLSADEALTANASAKQGLADMKLLVTLLRAYNVLDRISFDMSLARGLDYYTGIIYEAIVEASAPPGFKHANAFATAQPPPTPTPALAPTSPSPLSPPPSARTPRKKLLPPKKPAKSGTDDAGDEIDESQVGVGSIAAGGRYDGLVGMFTSAAAAEGKKGAELPCVGVSIGLDRVFALVWPKWVEKGMGRCKETMVYVVAAGDGLLEERVKLVGELRGAGIKSDFLAKTKPKLFQQFAAGEKDEVPFVVILGSDELQAGLVTVKEQKWELVDGQRVKIESADKGMQVKRDELVQWIKQTSTYVEWASGNWV